MLKKIFKIEFYRGIYSNGLYIGILLIFVTGFIAVREVWAYIQNIGLPNGDVRCFSVFFQAMKSEKLCYSIPVVVTFTLSTSYLDDVQSGTLKYILIRTKKNWYLWSKVLTCALFGGLTVLLALFVLLVGFMIVYPINTVEMGYLRMQTAQYYTDLFGRAAALVLNGSFYASLGGVIGTITNNKYMAYAAPFIFYYVVSTLFSAYLSDYPLLNPEEWMMMNVSSIFGAIGIVLVLNIASILGYFKVVERRWRHD